MRFSRSDLADLVYFLALAKHRSFRRAGLELGVTASALSHAVPFFQTVRLSRSQPQRASGSRLKKWCNGPGTEVARRRI